MIEKYNTKSYWNDRVKEAKGDVHHLVYNSASHFAASQEAAEIFIKKFIKAGDNVLDVGCGYGRFYDAIKAQGATYTGIDFSIEMIQLARSKHPGGEFTMFDWANVSDLEYFTKYNVIFESICLSSFNGTLEEFKRHLLSFAAADAIVIMIEPEEVSVTSRDNLFAR